MKRHLVNVAYFQASGFTAYHINIKILQRGVPMQALRASWGNRGTAILLLDLGTRWTSAVKFMPWPL
jgi:hypothetical protein